MFDDLKRGMKRSLVENSMVGAVRKALGYRAKNVRMENGRLKASPTDKFIEECGSEEEADKELDRIGKKVVKKYANLVGKKASSSVSNKKIKKMREVVNKELKE